MPGLVPGLHAFGREAKTWRAGTRPAMTNTECIVIFSKDRILTTHVGSLPRNETLSDLLVVQEEGKSYDERLMATEMDKAVRHVVQKQLEAGIDVGNDG